MSVSFSSPVAPDASQSDPALRTLVDELLDEQNKLQTPVARFSEKYDQSPDLEDHYRSLIPLTKPGEGEQYAFEVALDQCTGCKACVSACHSLNGLDDYEAWRDAGVIVGGDEEPAWQQTVTTACHHCEDPGCLNGCPVGAYEKDQETGIVRHLDDQCIGCSYCILKCPYDVPKYSEKRGIVRKCDMCYNRLSEGEAPACVQACPTEAIRIVKVKTQIDRIPPIPGPGHLLTARGTAQSAIPSSSITMPTTRYVGREVPTTAHAADREALVPQHAHWPLVFMLVLTQAGMGICAGATHFGETSISLLIAGTVIFNLGMGAATLHLGQPLKAWRFFLGLRTSWLSREILAFSMFAPIPPTLCALYFLPDFPFKSLAQLVTTYSLLPVGLVAVFTSVMIYADTHRDLWSVPRGSARFFGTVVGFTTLTFAAVTGSLWLVAVFALVVALKFVSHARLLKLKNSEEWSADRHTARMTLGPLKLIFKAHLGLSLLAVAIAFSAPWVALPILLFAEVFERQLFFQAVHGPKMPGNFGPKSMSH